MSDPRMMLTCFSSHVTVHKDRVALSTPRTRSWSPTGWGKLRVMALSSTKTFHHGVGDDGQYTLTIHLLGNRIISAECKALWVKLHSSG